MISMSVSELLTWQKCRRHWAYRYAERLAPLQEARSWQLASGTAVHYVVETLCRDFPGQVPALGDLKLRAAECLQDEFAGAEQPDKMLAKYGPGVVRALLKVPQWVWQADWFVERDVAAVFPAGSPAIELRGRVDMVYAADGIVELVDLKTTATSPTEYMLWEPQIRYYAAMLQQRYPHMLVQYRYLCLPTQGDKPAPQAPAWAFTQRQYAATVAEIVQLAGEVDAAARQPRYSRACSWCAFKDICAVVVTGGDDAAVKREGFYVRPRR